MYEHSIDKSAVYCYYVYNKQKEYKMAWNTKIIGWVLGGLVTIGAASGVSTSLNHVGDTGIRTDYTQTQDANVPIATTEIETKTIDVPYTTEYVDDANLASGVEELRQVGINGEKVEYYTVTYADGVETSRKLTKTEITTAAVNEVIARGTYVAPTPTTSPTTNCPNGTYVNSAGNIVCRPSSENTGGATAICKDGSYSYSQSRRGNCSHHGGVKSWL